MRGDEGTRNGGFQEGRMPGSGGTGESVSSLELGTENQVEERNPSPKSQPTLWISLPTQAPLGPLYLLEEFHGVSGGEGRWWRGAGTAVVMAGPRDAVHRAPRVVVAFQGVAVGHEGAPVTPQTHSRPRVIPHVPLGEPLQQIQGTGKGVPLHQEGGPAPKHTEVQGKWQGFEDSTLRPFQCRNGPCPVWGCMDVPEISMMGTRDGRHGALRVALKVPRSL